MNTKYVDKALENCKTLDTAGYHQYVFVSDMHLGCKDNADETVYTQHLIFHALKWYYDNNYTVICLGDTFELAETPNIEKIKNAHDDIMWVLTELYKSNRLFIVRGNHEQFLTEEMLLSRESQYDGKRIPFLPYVKIYDSVKIGDDIIAMHGNQDKWYFSTWINQVIVKLGGIWKWYQLHCKDFHVSESTGWEQADSTQEFFNQIGKDRNTHFVIGHTHKCSFKLPYMTDAGSFGCMPRCITCVEVLGKNLFSCKWAEQADKDGFVKIAKTEIGAQRLIKK